MAGTVPRINKDCRIVYKLKDSKLMFQCMNSTIKSCCKIALTCFMDETNTTEIISVHLNTTLKAAAFSHSTVIKFKRDPRHFTKS